MFLVETKHSIRVLKYVELNWIEILMTAYSKQKLSPDTHYTSVTITPSQIQNELVSSSPTASPLVVKGTHILSKFKRNCGCFCTIALHSKNLSCGNHTIFSRVMQSHTIFLVKNASRVISHEKIFLVWWKITRFFMWMNVWGNEAIFIEYTDFFLVPISISTDGWSIHDNFMLHWALFSH